MFSSFISSMIIYLMVLLGMSFFTLLERKALGYFQLRKGPNKVGIMGLLQPFSDALKLFSKEMNVPMFSNFGSYIFAPVLGLVLAMMMWFMYPSNSSVYMIEFGILLFMCVSSLSVYVTMISGWSSNSKYSLLGSLRSVAQTISYEVSMALVLLGVLVLVSELNFSVILVDKNMGVMYMLFPLFLVWFITTLAETNRTPFDFAEGESELVSGFNTEYSGVSFALIFMAEYLNIICMSMFSCVLFFNYFMGGLFVDLMFMILTVFVSFIFIWVRGSFPRMRYDYLMMLTWKGFLPFSLGVLIMFISVGMIVWYCAGSTGNFDGVKYEIMSSMLSLESCNN